ncbi:MAG: UGSC family (seleno)protein, partial [Desulfitobacteriaceae bacterium]|nr:UGSC family (seleno)protein [Desulfitobacteriaceae bacterium]
MAKAEARALGYPDLPMVIIPHPLGGKKPDDVRKLAEITFEAIVQYVSSKTDTGNEQRIIAKDNPELITINPESDDLQAFFYDKGWTDGLPVVAPTPSAVEAMLHGVKRDPEESLGIMPPNWAEVTVRKVAINSVMAGCLPSYFPVVLTAVEAMLEKSFNLYGVLATTHPCSPLIIVNGPIAQELGINGKGNCFGQGWRSNATIGRAVHLVLQNVGGALPGKLDKATMGHPGKFSYCIAENEENNPWQALHIEKGFAPEVSTVTVVAAEAPHNINDHGSTTGQGLLTSICGTLVNNGHNNWYWSGDLFIVLGPEHAATIAADGFSKEDVKEYVFKNTKIKAERMAAQQLTHIQTSTPEDYVNAEGMIRLTKEIEDINIIVAGGPGKHSMWIPT